MFCDHYSLVSSSLTSFQLKTCTAYYQNAALQPWYIALVTLVPILVGTIVMVRNVKRTIYDTLSLPLFIAVVGLFLFRIKNYVKSLAAATQASDGAKEEYLKQIAYTHVIMGVLLVLLLILQALAQGKPKTPAKKKL
jgi:uncharacterized membrane protein YvlD (DUF360 family)